MKYLLIVLASFFAVALAVNSRIECKIAASNIPNKWANMNDSCVTKMTAQIKEELTASLTYMAMGSYFAQDKQNRPGFSEFFFKSASEEREHAIKLLEYLLMRGELIDFREDLINIATLTPKKTSWTSGQEALEEALKLETHVTNAIRGIIKACEDEENSNDHHVVDYLINEYLEEQYHGQRDIAGKLSVLSKMALTHSTLAEFLFDKKMLKGEV